MSDTIQINNIRIKSVRVLDKPMWLCVAPDGRKLESFSVAEASGPNTYNGLSFEGTS